MYGEIGSLVQDGEQIGGFLNWTIGFVWAGDRLVAIKSTADSFWLVSCPSQGEITALCYRLARGKLMLITQSKVDISLDCELDRMINKRLEMKWMT